MQPEKNFVWSRGLWAAAIPLVVAIANAAGVDTENLAGELDRLGETVVLLVASVLALWSRFRPDGARLRVAPKLPPSGPLGFAVVVLVLSGCASLGGLFADDGPARFAVTYATLRVIDEDPGRAERILELTEGAESAAGAVALDVLEREAWAAIDGADLSQADRDLAIALLFLVRQELEDRLAAGEIEDVVDVEEVLGWVRSAASTRAP